MPQDLPALLADSEQFSISGDIDFGVVSVTPPAAWSDQGSASGHLLSDLRTMAKGRDEAWELDKTVNTSMLQTK